MNKLICLIYLFLLCVIIGCKNSNATGKDVKVADTAFVKYAKGFRVLSKENYKLVDITDPTGASGIEYKYALVGKSSRTDDIPPGYTIIRTPLNKVICMTTLQLSGFIKLNATDRIVGITSTRFLKNNEINRRLKDKSIHKIGIEGEFDSEVIFSISPDVIFISPFKRGGYDALENLDIPMICYMGYKESSPLGQAEWIKFIGMLIDKEDEARAIFDGIEENYNNLKKITDNVTVKPKVMSGELHSGSWYVVGGNSYLAQIFRDAGAEYFMVNDNESGGYYLDYETVYSQGHDCNFWRIVNSYNGVYDYDALKASDARYADFNPFKQKKVIYCNLRDKPFYENTPMEPDVVLADLINIFHPSLMHDYKPVYYEILK